MSEQIYDFHERVHRINRKRAKANRSMRSTFVDSDGYVIVRAKSRARGLPFLGLLLLTMGFFALKSVMIAQLGQEAYDLRIQEVVGAESLLTQTAAWALQADGLSLALVPYVTPYV